MCDDVSSTERLEVFVFLEVLIDKIPSALPAGGQKGAGCLKNSLQHGQVFYRTFNLLELLS